MKKYFLFTIIFLLIFSGFGFFVLAEKLKSRPFIYYSKPKLYFWNFRSVDTMKYSRDLSREKADDSDFEKIIDSQVKNIASIGANYVAIATPYDDEFLPFLKKWTGAARKYGLKVWFRGNWSGWEKWFGYPEITPEEHIQKIKDFILANGDIFEDGDVFSSCPECENGALGDPRLTGNPDFYRKFLVSEYREAKAAFKAINKKVGANYFSMNADVARLVMDRETTELLDGIAVLDHYVESPEKLKKDVEEIALASGGKIILGEFGAPIPDIHGEMTEQEQARWIQDALNLLAGSGDLIGVNYWVNVGGTTAIWNDQAAPFEAAGILEQFYRPESVYGAVQDELGGAIAEAEIFYSAKSVLSDQNGYFEIACAAGNAQDSLTIAAPGFIKKEISISEGVGRMNIVLTEEKGGMPYKLRVFLKKALEK